MVVLGHRIREGRTAAGRGIEAVRPLADTPAEVLASLRPIDLLPTVLADVANPQIAVRTVEREPPRIAQPPNEDFRARASADAGQTRTPGIGREDVRWGNRIWRTGVDVDTDDRSEQVGALLRVVVRVSPATTVAEGRIQETVRSEFQVAAIVIDVVLIDGQQDLFAGSLQREAAVEAQEARDPGNVRDATARSGRRVRHEYLWRCRELRVEGET